MIGLDLLKQAEYSLDSSVRERKGGNDFDKCNKTWILGLSRWNRGVLDNRPILIPRKIRFYFFLQGVLSPFLIKLFDIQKIR